MLQDAINAIAATINGWGDALTALAARIRALTVAATPDLTPLTDAVAKTTAAAADVAAAVSEKDGQ